MTIKGKKTGSLPKMTREQILRFNSGELLDVSFPEDKLRAIPGIPDPEAFFAFLAPLVDRYRALTDSDHVPMAEELTWAETTIDFAHETGVRLSNIPTEMFSSASAAHWKRHKEELSVAITRLTADLAKVETTLLLAMRIMELPPGKAGRKPMRERDSLLTAVADWIVEKGSKTDEAARISRRVLFALGIPDPDKPATVIREHKKWLQQMGD